MYDIIGDIHGYADELEMLLRNSVMKINQENILIGKKKQYSSEIS